MVVGTVLLLCCYFRLYGSYESLKGGKTSEALVDFTGGLVESFDLTKKEEAENALSQMIKAGKKSSFMSCSIRWEIGQELLCGWELLRFFSSSLTTQSHW